MVGPHHGKGEELRKVPGAHPRVLQKEVLGLQVAVRDAERVEVGKTCGEGLRFGSEQ